MSIRSASSSDFNEIRTLLHEHGRPTPNPTASDSSRFLVCRTDEPVDDRQALLRTVAILPTHRLTSEGEICGTVGFETYGSTALVRSMLVEPEHRGEGTGTRLLNKIEREARQEGAERLYLLTTSPDFFENRGYDRTRRAAVPEPIANSTVVDVCPSEAAVMTKRIGPEASTQSAASSAETDRARIDFRTPVHAK